MEEEGIVREIEGDEALVALVDQGGCESCPSAGICHTAGNERQVRALNGPGARVGQRVKVVMQGQMYLKGTMVVYGLPMAVLVAGAILGQTLAENFFPAIHPDLMAAGTGLSAMVLVFLGARAWSRKIERSGTVRPVIEEILNDAGS